MNTEQYDNLWDYKIKKAFSKKTKGNGNIIWQIVNLILFHTTTDTTLIDLYNFYEDKSEFVRFVNEMGGRNINVPNKKELEDILILAMVYYEKEIKGKTWEEIKDEFNFKISSIKYGIKIRNLDSWLKQKIQEIIRREGNYE